MRQDRRHALDLLIGSHGDVHEDRSRENRLINVIEREVRDEDARSEEFERGIFLTLSLDYGTGGFPVDPTIVGIQCRLEKVETGFLQQGRVAVIKHNQVTRIVPEQVEQCLRRTMPLDPDEILPRCHVAELRLYRVGFTQPAVSGDYQRVDGLTDCHTCKLPDELVHSPFCIEIFFRPEFCALIHVRYDSNRERALEAFEARDWSGFVFAHERGYRFEALSLVSETDISTRELADLVLECWIDSENIHQNAEEWADLLARIPHEYFLAALGADDKETFAKLPEEIEIYRGAKKGLNEEGLSWTLDREKAEWFANRFEREDEEGIVLTRTVKKKDIAFYTNRRGEDEVVVATDL